MKTEEKSSFAMVVVTAALLNVPLSWTQVGVEGSGFQGPSRGEAPQVAGRQGLEYLLRQRGDVMNGLFAGGRAPSADLRDMLAKGKRSFEDLSLVPARRLWGNFADRSERGREIQATQSTEKERSDGLARISTQSRFSLQRMSRIRAETVVPQLDRLRLTFSVPLLTRLPLNASLVLGDTLSFVRAPTPLLCRSGSTVDTYSELTPASGAMDVRVLNKISIADVTACVRAALEAEDSDVTVELLLPCVTQPALCEIEDSPVILLIQ